MLRLTKAPKAYATCLTNLAEHRLGRRAAALSLGAWEKQSELARRVHSILRGGEGMGRTQARVVMGVVVVGLLGGSAELARCPQLVSFSRTALPVAVAVQVLRLVRDIEPVCVSRSGLDGAMTVGPHETLLKASMPVMRQWTPVACRRTGVRRRRLCSKPQCAPLVQSHVDAELLRRAEGWLC